MGEQGGWPSGWYADPWSPGQQRYWTGTAWTADVAPGSPPSDPAGPAGPAGPGGEEAPVASPGLAGEQAPPWHDPAPSWEAGPPGGAPAGPEPRQLPDAPDAPGAGAPASGSELPPPPEPSSKGLGPVITSLIVLIIAAMVAAVVVIATGGSKKASSSAAAPASSSGPSVAPGSTIPAPGSPGLGTVPATIPPPAGSPQALLSQLGVSQTDVPNTDTVDLIQGGDQVQGQPTLDLCNASFPSESRRADRRQVVAVDGANDVFSTEAVLYDSANGTAQAFTELRAAKANCPATPVVSPVGLPKVTTAFNPLPDAQWPQTAAVERLAYDFNATDASNAKQRTVAVYLRRGRVLLALYFASPPTVKVPVDNQSTIPDIVTLFARRMAALPGSVVNGTAPANG